MITVGLNKELDKKIYRDFHDFSVAGADFGGLIRETHPSISLENHERYIDNFYSENAPILNSAVKNLNTELTKINGEFFRVVQKYFNLDLKNETYTGFISIFNCNPRFVESKSFQVYYKKDLLAQLEVCLHEVTHFAFFEKAEECFGMELGQEETNSGKLWELSEIVNVFLLNQSEFRKILRREELLFYPALKEKLESVSLIWDKHKKVSCDFLREWEQLGL